MSEAGVGTVAGMAVLQQCGAAELAAFLPCQGHGSE